MTISKLICRIAMLVLCSAICVRAGYAQLSKSVGLLKADVTLADGSPAADVPIAIFRGTDRISTTKSSQEGKVTTVLQPNSIYRFVVNSNGYMYREDTLTIGALKSYQEFPVHIVVAPLRDGQPFDLANPIFAPRSQDILIGAHSELDRIVLQMKHNPKLSTTMTVYPDAMPKSKKDNSQTILASARGNSMRSYFLSKGVSESSFSIVSNTSSIPPGKFSPTDPVFPPISTAAPQKGKKKAKYVAPASPGMVPQYVEAIAHIPS